MCCLKIRRLDYESYGRWHRDQWWAWIMFRNKVACRLHSCQEGFSLSLSPAQPTERNGHHSFSPTNFHLPAALRTQRTLGGSGTPPETPGRPPRGRSASAGAAGSSALRRWPPLRSWPLVVCWEAKKKRAANLPATPKVGHASETSRRKVSVNRHFDTKGR